MRVHENLKKIPGLICLLLFLSGGHAIFDRVVFYMEPIALERHPITNEFVPERWCPVNGFEGCYEISNYGRVLSLERDDANDHKIIERILKPDDSSAYLRVTLCLSSVIHRRFSSHILVARHFIPNPENKPCVNHEDGIKTHNFELNLSWATYSENSLHSFRTGLQKPSRAHLGRRGSLHHRSKRVLQLSPSGVQIQEWESSCLAADALGISQANISAVCNGIRATTGGFKWRYI